MKLSSVGIAVTAVATGTVTFATLVKNWHDIFSAGTKWFAPIATSYFAPRSMIHVDLDKNLEVKAELFIADTADPTHFLDSGIAQGGQAAMLRVPYGSTYTITWTGPDLEADAIKPRPFVKGDSFFRLIAVNGRESDGTTKLNLIEENGEALPGAEPDARVLLSAEAATSAETKFIEQD